MISSFSEKTPVYQHGMTTYEALEEKLMGKMRNIETQLHVEGKINDKFNQILEKLDGNTGNVVSRPSENRSKGGYYRGRGAWRGNSNYHRSNSNDRRVSTGRGQGQRSDQGKRTDNYTPNE